MDGGEVILKGATEPAKTRSEKKGVTKEKSQKVKNVQKVKKENRSNQRTTQNYWNRNAATRRRLSFSHWKCGVFFIFSKGSSATKQGIQTRFIRLRKKRRTLWSPC